MRRRGAGQAGATARVRGVWGGEGSIVADSVPHAEFLETESKLGAVLRALEEAERRVANDRTLVPARVSGRGGANNRLLRPARVSGRGQGAERAGATPDRRAGGDGACSS